MGSEMCIRDSYSNRRRLEVRFPQTELHCIISGHVKHPPNPCRTDAARTLGEPHHGLRTNVLGFEQGASNPMDSLFGVVFGNQFSFEHFLNCRVLLPAPPREQAVNLAVRAESDEGQ